MSDFYRLKKLHLKGIPALRLLSHLKIKEKKREKKRKEEERQERNKEKEKRNDTKR